MDTQTIQLIAIKALQLLCSLSLLVVLHEGGHFFFSKVFHVRVEKFYMFFNPWFHLFSTRDRWFARLFPRIASNETEYGIGWIPLGGYVKIAGMIDESMDKEQMKQPAKADEFRSQPIWKRFFIMVGGVLVNLITAFVIYSAIMFTWGEDLLPMRNIKDGFEYNQAAMKMGFHRGDIPVKLDGKEIRSYTGSAPFAIALSKSNRVTVLRQGKEVEFALPEEGLDMLELLEMQPALLTPIAEAIIDSVTPQSPAEKAGMHDGDRLLAINGTTISTWGQYDSLALRRQDILAAEDCSHKDSVSLRRMIVVFQHQGAEQADTATMQLGEDYLMGVLRAMPDYEIEHVDYNLLTCIPAGCSYAWGMLYDYVYQLKYIPTKKGVQSVGSFISIGSIFPDSWQWDRFWHITALLSIILAVMNILPIPGLDGGHVVVLLYEAIFRRSPSDRAMTILEYIGLALIGALMLLAFSNDIIKFIL